MDPKLENFKLIEAKDAERCYQSHFGDETGQLSKSIKSYCDAGVLYQAAQTNYIDDNSKQNAITLDLTDIHLAVWRSI